MPAECEETIQLINETKQHIGKLLSKTVDSRAKIDGQWQPMNKMLLRAIGRPRANIKQVKRRLNVHSNSYTRISYSGTFQRPNYRKDYEYIDGILAKYTSETAMMDRETLKKYAHVKEFALFYDKYYNSMDGNFKLIDPKIIINEDGSKSKSSFVTEKISSPIYILCDCDVNDINLEVRYKMKEEKKSRSSYKVVISETPILKSLPVYLYE